MFHARTIKVLGTSLTCGLLVSWVLFLASGGSLEAQITTATLTGTVKDPSGALIAGAKVEAKEKGTDRIRTTDSATNGQYVLSDLPVGHYEVKITIPGFKAWLLPDIELQVSQHAAVDATLEVGSVDQELTVTAVAPLLSTTTSSVGQVVNTNTVERMPLNGRLFWQLTQLTPGAIPAPVTQGTTGGGKAIRASSVNVSINGTSQIWTGWSLDGASITEPQLGGTNVQPNVDAIQEFKVESANMPAEFGHTPTMINASIKNGTNAYHGGLFEFVRNDKFDARNFFYLPPPGSSLTNEPLRRNQYGFTFGGPIRRNRTFFFADLERTNLRQGLDFNNVVPSMAMRSGDFSELLRASKPSSIVDPTTRASYPNNLIPASLIAPQAVFFMKYLPQPNLLQGTTSRAVLTNNTAIDTTKGDVRVDHDLTASNRLMGRYSIADNTETDPNAFPALGRPDLQSRAQSAVLSDTHIFSPKWINTARFSYYRSLFYFGPILPGANINAAAGVQGFDNLTSVYGFPNINITGFASYSGSPSDQRPKSNRIRNKIYGDTMSYANGKHDIKFGAELTHMTIAFFNGSNSEGTCNFLGTYTGNAFGDVLLGYPNNVSRDYYKNLYGNTGDFWSFFFQDNIRLRQNLTLNVGLRWEINPFYDGIRGGKAAFDRTTGKVVVPSNFDPTLQTLAGPLMNAFKDRILLTSALGLPNSIQPSDKHDIAPRLGLAWRPSNDWVVRVAYGLFFVFPDDNTFNNTIGSVPFIASQTVFNATAPAAPTLTWANFFQGQPLFSANPNPGQVCAFGFAALSCSTPNLSASEVTMHSTYLQQWNISMQRQITASTALDLAYVGNKTTHLNTSWGINDPAPGPGAIQARRPYPQWGTINYPGFNGNGNYNALQAKIETRNWRGLSLLGSYTFSKCIDNGSSQGGATLLVLPFNRGICDYDVPQNFAGSFDYQLPFGAGKTLFGKAHGWSQQVLGGWELAGIVITRTGLPFSPSVGGDPENTGVGTRPDVIGQPVLPHTVSCWFFAPTNPACTALVPNGTAAFAVPPAMLRYGTAGRNLLRADTLQQVDLSLLKIFPFTESKRLEFRGEVFNILNHPTFSGPSTDITSSSVGQIGSTVNASRVIQLGLKLSF